MITSEKVFKVVEVFDRALELKEGKADVDMAEPIVSSRGRNMHSCGTIHCCAGWYYIGKHWDGKQEYFDTYTSYEEGMGEMANDLGFPDEIKLTSWARCNPEIWGNSKDE